MYKSYSELGNQPEKNKDLYSVLELSTNEQKTQLINSCSIVCVDIYANWCGPCKQTEAAYSVLAQRYNKEGFCMLVKENFQNNLTNNVNGLPTYQFFVSGKFQEQVVGADLEAVEKTLNKYINIYQNNNVIQGPNFNRNGIRTYKNQSTQDYTEPVKYQQHSPNGAVYQSYSMNNNKN